MTRERGLFLTAGMALVAVFAAIGSSASLHTRVGYFLALYGFAFAAYVLGVRIAFRAEPDRWLLGVMLAVAVVARAVLVPAHPDLSTDIHRYLWEGRVVLHGGNPFALAPADSSLTFMRDDGFELVNHRDMATIYPPLAQGAFALGAWLHPTVTMLKALFVLFDIATVMVLMKLLRARGRSPGHALVYAWSPLVILETGHSGHLDALGVFFLVCGILLLTGRRERWGFVALGAAFLAKYLTVVLLPFFVVRRRWAGILIVVAVAVVGYLPFAGAGAELVRSLRTYSGTWWFNGPPFMALSGILGEPITARRLLAAAGIVFAIAAAFRERDLARYTYLVIGCSLLLAPTVYPWYLIWMVPFLCIFPNRGWIAFTGLVALSYWVWVVYAASGAWIVPTRVLAAEYIPFYLLLAWEAARGSRVEGERRG
ncbi:MAG TPA: glycosyltransferase 87 family protein [Candidatus Krumholzibacteria bacterium]|nr:glycosyltransferase 87 family protein [Candidatus Krumholzibacteria bacterium]